MDQRADMERDVVRRIQPLARRLRALANAAVASLDLSDATGWALLHLLRSGSEVSQARLAAALEISGASLVRLLGQLEQRGFVRREADAADRRPTRIRLLPQGKAVAERIEALLQPLRADLFAGFSDDEVRVMAALLARLDARTQATGEAAP